MNRSRLESTSTERNHLHEGARYLLILSCSKRKTSLPGKWPAIQVYDGPIYRSLRKRLNCLDLSLVDICIISAKYGLITAGSTIEHYDCKMTAERAVELRDVVLSELIKMIQNRSYKEILINLGSVYRIAIYGIEKYVPNDTQPVFTSGGIGRKTSQTISWLERVASVGLNSEQIR